MQSISLNQNAEAIRVISLPGLSRYEDVHALQLKLVEERIADQIPDTLIFCVHESVITRGRGLQRREGEERRSVSLPSNVRVIDVERGGDLTWHGPGQLVLYPIFKIRDVEQWIRTLEATVMGMIPGAERKAQSSGVWLRGKKVASVGIAVRKWVSYHGIALNVVNKGMDFKIAGEPCGLSFETMASLFELQGLEGPLEGWRAHFEQKWLSSAVKVLDNRRLVLTQS